MKKMLSMVLALVMTVSLFAFAPADASAAFTDSGSITYKEAVDVIYALGIMGGYSDGSFRPTGLLTRGAAAKIICCMMLTPSVANAMSNNAASKFKDVPAGHTFAGFISWCVQQGIVSGYSDNTFHPADPLTCQAFLKMLLCALGYDQEIEHYTGSGWSNNVTIRAQQIGLNNGLNATLNGAAQVNRQDACLFAFNTLKANLVEYTGSRNTRSERTTTDNSKGQNIVAEAGPSYTLQFAEQYFPKLKQTANTTDAFGCPATKWTLDNTDVGAYLASVDVVYYNEDVTAARVYRDLGLNVDTALTFYVNGESVAAADAKIKRNDDAKLSSFINQPIGNGVEIRAFRITNGNTPTVVLSAVVYYPGKISSVQSATSTKNRYVTIDGITSLNRAPAGLAEHNQYETEDFENGDIVAYTFSRMKGNEGVQEVIKLDTVRGSLDRVNSGSSLTVDGREYENALKVVYNNADGDEQSLTVGNAYTVYLLGLDEKDMVMWVENVKVSSDSYAWVKDVTDGINNFDYAQARLVFANGTEQVVRLNNYAAPNSLKQHPIVTYTVDANNRYALTPVTTTTAESVTFRNRSGLPEGVSATNATLFVVEVEDTGSYKVYEGMRSMPNVQGKNAYFYTEDGAAVVVFVTNATITTSSSDLIFLAANSASNPVRGMSATYRTFNAVVDGTITKVNVIVGTTLGSKEEKPAPGTQLVVANNSDKIAPDNSVVLNNTEYDANNFMIAGSYESNTVGVSRAQGYSTPANGAIRLGGVLMDLSSSVNVYSVSTTGSISKINVNNVREDSNDWVYYTQDNRDITNLFILRVD